MAQRSVSSFKSTKNSRYADNSSGSITEANGRDMFEDVADSFLNKTDDLLDEDDMASNSATKVPSQQSVKAYVDANIGGELETVTIDVSSAEILDMFSNPVQLIAAPGAGKFIQVVYGWVYYNAGASGYSSGTPAIQYASGTILSGAMTAFLTGTDDRLLVMSATSNVIDLLTDLENNAIEFTQVSSNPTTGDGTVKINLVYRIVTF